MDKLMSIINRIIDFFKRLFKKNKPVEGPSDNPFDVVVYYGCPNSKKVEKLQTSKENYKG